MAYTLAYCDKEGNPIDCLKWGKLYDDNDYRIVGKDIIGGTYYVSTVWLGIPPNIFETMVFPIIEDKIDFMAEICRIININTKDEARESHLKLVNKYTNIVIKDSIV